MSLFDDVARRVGGGVLTVGNTVTTGAAGMVGETVLRNGIGVIRRNLPAGMGPVVNVANNAGGAILRGDAAGAVTGVLDSGVLHRLQPQASGAISQALFLATPNPLMGGITPLEAQAIYEQCQAETFARQNLFLLEITRLGTPDGVPEAKFNLFATQVSYAPYTIAGDRAKIGGTSVDIPQSSEPVEIRVTTLDDQYGTLKRWFGALVAAVVHADGTVGLPKDYLVKIRVAHSFVTAASAGTQAYDGGSGLYRAVNLDLSLSRRDDALEELQMAFTQFDPFHPVP